MSTYQLTREIPVDQPFDLVVLGGGPGGASAAICAGRLGARVLLIEATGCMGGMGTSGLVTAFNPMANGERMLVGGLMREIVETMYDRGFMQAGASPDMWRKDFMHWAPFKVEGYKLILDELAIAAGVEVRFFTRLIDVDIDANSKRVNGVVVHNIEGYRYVPAKTFIDGTGDAVLADLCGVDCREAGRDTVKIMPPTLCSLFGGLDWPRMGNQQECLSKALAAGHFTQYDRHMPGMMKVGQTTGILNAGHVFNLNALRCDSLSGGMMLGRRLAQEYVCFYKKYVPGCENLEHVTTASLMGVRESRRIVGEYELNIDDFQARRQFPDQIGVFCNFVDIHVCDESDEEWERFLREKDETARLMPGEMFGIPYSILVPKGWANLWVAGRSASSDVMVHGAIRVQPAASMMGQAAGTAAVQSIKTGEPACDLNTERLVATLRAADAYLPQQSTAAKMTR